MHRSFFRRRARPEAEQVEEAFDEFNNNKKTRKRDKKRNSKKFGRVGSLQHVRPGYQVDDIGQVEEGVVVPIDRGRTRRVLRRGGTSSHELHLEGEKGDTNDFGIDDINNDYYYDNNNNNVVDEIPPYKPKGGANNNKQDSNLADDGHGNDGSTTPDLNDDTNNVDTTGGNINIDKHGDVNGNGEQKGEDHQGEEGARKKGRDRREEQPKLGRIRSGKSRRRSSRGRSRDKDREREKSRGRDAKHEANITTTITDTKEKERNTNNTNTRDGNNHHHHHTTSSRNHHHHHTTSSRHHGRRRNNTNTNNSNNVNELDEEASLLIELNKLLDTLTSRELQLTLRVDKATEAVKAAVKNSTISSSGDGSGRKRAMCALKHKKVLEKSLAITTAQSDRVLKLLGHNVLTPLAARIEAAYSATIPNNCIIDGTIDTDSIDMSNEQIMREIDATIADTNNTIMAPKSCSAILNINNTTADKSSDWLAEVREQHARRTATLSDKVPPQNIIINTQAGTSVDDFETVPEAIVSLGSPRPSRETRADSHSNIPATSGGDMYKEGDLRPSKSSSSFSRKRRKSSRK